MHSVYFHSTTSQNFLILVMHFQKYISFPPAYKFVIVVRFPPAYKFVIITCVCPLTQVNFQFCFLFYFLSSCHEKATVALMLFEATKQR